MKNYLDYFIPKYQNTPGPLPEIEERNGIYYINGQVVGEKPVSGTDPIGQLWVEGAILGKPFELGLKGLGLLGKAGWKGLSKVAPKATGAVETGVNAAGTALKQVISKINPFKRKLQITAKNTSKITPKQWDLAYNKAIEIGDLEEAQRLRDLHFLAKTPETKIKDVVWHSSEEPFTEFDLSKFGATDNGFFGYGFYFTPYEKYAASYHPINRRFFVNVKNPYIGQNSEQFNRLQYVHDILQKRKSKVLEEFKSGKLSSFAEKQGISLNMSYDQASHLMDNYIAKQMPKWNNKYLRFQEEFTGKDGVFEMRRLQGDITKPTNITEIVIPKSEQIKLADAVTYDNSGKVIPLSKRDNFTNPDIRYMWVIPTAVTTTKLVNNKQKNESIK